MKMAKISRNEPFLCLSLSAQSLTFTFSASIFVCTEKLTLNFVLCFGVSLLPPLFFFHSLCLCLFPPLESVSTSISLSLSLSLILNIFLQGKHFHLRYGWLFNAVNPSELEEAWCSAFFSGVQMDLPPKHTLTHSLSYLAVPHPSSTFLFFRCMSCSCHFSK